jgi:exonuclease VII small subunit
MSDIDREYMESVVQAAKDGKLAITKAEAEVEELTRERDAERKAVERDVAQYRGILASTRREASKQATRAEAAEAKLAAVVKNYETGLAGERAVRARLEARLAAVVEALERALQTPPTQRIDPRELHAALADARGGE